MREQFLRIMCFVLLVCGVALSQEDEENEIYERPKIVYVNVISAPQEDEEFYVGQEVRVTYEISLLAGAKLRSAKFSSAYSGKLELRNKPNWENLGNNTLSATYVFKILSRNASIPAMLVNAISADESYEESVSANQIQIKTTDLRSNARYTGVLGSDFKVLWHKEKASTNENIVIFEFEVKSPNAEDLYFKNIKNQGFDELTTIDGVARGIYYVLLPKEQSELNFEYFNLNTARFEAVRFPINATDEIVTTQSELAPKIGSVFFKRIALGLMAALFIGLYFWRNYKVFVFLGAIFIGMIIYDVVLNSDFGTVESGAQLSIVPMKNSTIIRVIESSTPAQILGERAAMIDGESVMFYKVLIDDEQVGWVRGEYVIKK